MDRPWNRQRGQTVIIKMLCALCCVSTVHSVCVRATNSDSGVNRDSDVDKALKTYLDDILNVDRYKIMPGVVIERAASVKNGTGSGCDSGRSLESIPDYVQRKLEEYTQTHVLSVNVPETARLFIIDPGKSTFMTGFGMGFLAFALKKLLLPVFIGAQLVKSVLIAMFLPSILGSVGKLLGKGLSTFSGISGASTGLNHNNNNQIEDFEFKDTSPYNNEDAMHDYNSPDSDTALSLNVASSTTAPITNTNSRFGIGNQRVSYVSQQHTDNNYYNMRKPNKKTDYKVFHKIPSSSLLLTSYDPFYSPLLSRLDAVFQQLGLGNDKSPETERCRERLVCMLYANPAKYAPYSNLVSAQLSRELNELRKPASDNPDILRFFRYMKAAKDGQDGEECLAHSGCPSLTSNHPSPAILTTFNEINKLVQARKFK